MGSADTETAVPLPNMMDDEEKDDRPSNSVEPVLRQEVPRADSPQDDRSSNASKGDGAGDNGIDTEASQPGVTSVEDWLVDFQQSKYSHAQNRIGLFVESRGFDLAMTVLIIINAVYIGIETDLNHDQDQSPNSGGWYGVECCFTALFTIELMLRLYGLKFWFFRDGWNLFDMLLVGTAVCDTFLLTIVMSALSEKDGDTDTLDVISAMRVARLLRLARIFRLLRFFKELWLLVAGVINSIRTLAWAWLLIVLIIYIFGILTTRTLGQQYGCRLDSSKGCDQEMDQYFGSVPESMFTFFQMITTEGWAYIARRSMGHLTASWVIFIFFMSLTTFAIMNVVIAVIVENTLDQAMQNEKDVAKKLDKERQKAMKGMLEVFRIADKDGSGDLTKDEFIEALKKPDVMKLLYEVEIDMRGAEGLFDILDYDESGSLDVTEFIEGCMRARGDAKAKDVLALQCDLWRTQQWVRNELQQMSDTVLGRFVKLEAEIHSISTCFLDEEVITQRSMCSAQSSSEGMLHQSSHSITNHAPVGLNSKSKNAKVKASPRSDGDTPRKSCP